jgi:hypothetical protein
MISLIFGRSAAPDVYVRGKRVRLDPAASVGKGGEADVFAIGGGSVLKVWKTPEHPDYAAEPAEQDGARDRIALHQRKLREFPKGLPARVIAPEELATDKSGRLVAGYTMRFVDGAEALLRYGEPSFRPLSATSGKALADLCGTVEALHARGVVIGDFNDLNVLVKDEEAYVIDADSFQFGPYLCQVFTERFVDPTLCDPAAARPCLGRPYGPGSDWYAFTVMVMQTLLSVGPFGGIYRPKSPSARIPESARPLRRITVFHPEVVYPKPAAPYGVLPDDLLQHLHAVFEKDQRDPFPRRLLDDLAWSKCPACGASHARAVCPFCVTTPPAAIKEITVVRGEVTATRLFATKGRIVAAALEDGELRWLTHEGGELRREDGRVVLEGNVDPFMRFAIQGKTTLIGKGARLVALAPDAPPERIAVDTAGGRPTFAANARHHYYAQGGRLMRASAAASGAIASLAAAPALVGDVLAGQTRIWAGDRFGFGFYRAGSLSVAFVFDAERPGLKDTVKLPFLAGELVGAECAIDDRRAWIFLAGHARGRATHQCAVVDASGDVLATAQADAGDGSWLGALGGKCAAGGFLLSATDAGLVRVEVKAGAIVETRRFPDAEPFVDGASRLFAGRERLFAVSDQEIRSLRIA